MCLNPSEDVGQRVRRVAQIQTCELNAIHIHQDSQLLPALHVEVEDRWDEAKVEQMKQLEDTTCISVNML